MMQEFLKLLQKRYKNIINSEGEEIDAVDERIYEFNKHIEIQRAERNLYVNIDGKDLTEEDIRTIEDKKVQVVTNYELTYLFFILQYFYLFNNIIIIIIQLLIPKINQIIQVYNPNHLYLLNQLIQQKLKSNNIEIYFFRVGCMIHLKQRNLPNLKEFNQLRLTNQKKRKRNNYYQNSNKNKERRNVKEKEKKKGKEKKSVKKKEKRNAKERERDQEIIIEILKGVVPVPNLIKRIRKKDLMANMIKNMILNIIREDPDQEVTLEKRKLKTKRDEQNKINNTQIITIYTKYFCNKTIKQQICIYF